jgi:hypothetical protein
VRRVLRWLVVPTLALLVTGSAGSTPSEQSNRQAAEQDASTARGLLQLPPGATRSDSNPAADQSQLASPGGVPATPNAVVQSEFWRVPGDPAAVRDWIKAHPPTGGRLVTEGSAGKIGQPLVWSIGFGFPPIRNVLGQRQVGATTTAAGGGGTAVRVDAFAVWMEPRLPSEHIPVGATTLDVVVRDRDRGLVKRLAMHDRSRIAAVTRMLNRLPVVQPGLTMCPLDRGFHAYLTLRRTPTGAPLARAVAELGGCGGVQLAINGQPQPPLSGFGLFADLESALGTIIPLPQPPPPEPAFPVAEVAHGAMPGGAPFRLVAYRDPRQGICANLYESGVEQASGCLLHPRGRRSSALTIGVSCYPRAVTGFAVLGGHGARSATGSFDDGASIRARAYELPRSTVTTRVGLGNGGLVRLERPATIALGYRGPFLIGFRRGVHALTRVDVAGGRATQQLRFDYGLFLQC